MQNLARSRHRHTLTVGTLTLLAALSGACSTMETGANEESGVSSSDSQATAPQGSSAEGSGSDSFVGTTSGGSSWTGGDDGATGTGDWTASASAGGTTGGYDPSGEEPPDDSGQGTTGGDDDETGTSSTGDTTTGGEVCDDVTPVTLYLSPDDSNSTSSPVQARDAVLGGFGSLYYVPIRPWEFLNYYTFDYEAAEPGGVKVTPELARLDGAPDGEYTLQIGVSSQALSNADRPAMNVTLVLDESGSMSGPPIEIEREVCRVIASSLRAGDKVSAVGWDTVNAVKLTAHAVTGPSDATLVALCDALEAGGGTDLNGGLTAGYELAQQQFDAERVNRVVLISDGGANAGVTDIDLIAGGAGSQDQDGIYLVGVGVGTADSYNDELMDTVTDVGRGASLFVGDKAEAEKMFGDRFVATMQVAARDVRVRLDMPPGFEVVKASAEEISADPQAVEPQHLAPNDAMVFHQTLATCAPQLVDEAASFTVSVQFVDAKTFEPKQVVEQRLIQEAVMAASPKLLKGAAVFAYAESLKAWRDGVVDHAAALAPAFAALAAAEAALPGDADLAEIREVLEAVQAMG